MSKPFVSHMRTSWSLLSYRGHLGWLIKSWHSWREFQLGCGDPSPLPWLIWECWCQSTAGATVSSAPLWKASRLSQDLPNRKKEGGEKRKEGPERLLIFPGLMTEYLCFLLVLQFRMDVSGRDGNITHVCDGGHLREWDEPCEENPLFGVRRNFPEVPQT